MRRMSAVNPKAHEPSMEEILASIRRIIADDQEELRAIGAERHAEAKTFRSERDTGERQTVAPLIPMTVFKTQQKGSVFEDSAPVTDEEVLPLVLEALQEPDYPRTEAPAFSSLEAQFRADLPQTAQLPLSPASEETIPAGPEPASTRED